MDLFSGWRRVEAEEGFEPSSGMNSITWQKPGEELSGCCIDLSQRWRQCEPEWKWWEVLGFRKCYKGRTERVSWWVGQRRVRHAAAFEPKYLDHVCQHMRGLLLMVLIGLWVFTNQSCWSWLWASRFSAGGEEYLSGLLSRWYQVH